MFLWRRKPILSSLKFAFVMFLVPTYTTKMLWIGMRRLSGFYRRWIAFLPAAKFARLKHFSLLQKRVFAAM